MSECTDGELHVVSKVTTAMPSYAMGVTLIWSTRRLNLEGISLLEGGREVSLMKQGGREAGRQTNCREDTHDKQGSRRVK